MFFKRLFELPQYKYNIRFKIKYRITDNEYKIQIITSCIVLILIIDL